MYTTLLTGLDRGIHGDGRAGERPRAGQGVGEGELPGERVRVGQGP
jgi:hypothetical protein